MDVKEHWAFGFMLERVKSLGLWGRMSVFLMTEGHATSSSGTKFCGLSVFPKVTALKCKSLFKKLKVCNLTMIIVSRDGPLGPY